MLFTVQTSKSLKVTVPTAVSCKLHCELRWYCRCYYYYGSTALCWALAAFQFLDLLHGRQDSLDGGSACYKASTLHTEQHKHRINAHNTDIHALSGIRTHDSSVRAGEDRQFVP
jgi:hypothetical protein